MEITWGFDNFQVATKSFVTRISSWQMNLNCIDDQEDFKSLAKDKHKICHLTWGYQGRIFKELKNKMMTFACHIFRKR